MIGKSGLNFFYLQNEELQREIRMLKKRVLSQSKILENTATHLEVKVHFCDWNFMGEIL